MGAQGADARPRRAAWSNWSAQEGCTPGTLLSPGDEAELTQQVVMAAARGDRIRPVGSGHSFSDLCCTDGTMVDLRRMNKLLDADPWSGLVRVQGGITLNALCRELAALGLALENQGDIDAQTISGAIATSTHGTGARFGNLGSRVEGVRLVTAAGEVHELTSATDADALRAARVSLGSLGVISELTIRVVPAFRVHRVARPRALDDVLAQLDEVVDDNDHFEMFAFPYSNRCLTLVSNRTGQSARPGAAWRRWIEDEVLANWTLGAAMRLVRARPSLAPRVSQTITRFLSGTDTLNDSHKVYSSVRKVRFTEMEYALPRPAVTAALQDVRDLIERERIKVAFPIEMRFSAADDAFLSTAHGRETAYLAVHQFVGMEYEPYFRAVEKIMISHGGRPHWGKRHFQTAESLAARYPQWDAFQAVRRRFDPHGRFSNSHIDRVLGAFPAGGDTA